MDLAPLQVEPGDMVDCTRTVPEPESLARPFHVGTLLLFGESIGHAQRHLRWDRSWRSPEIVRPVEVAYQVERVLDEAGIAKGETFVKELGRNRTFHDRELTFDAVEKNGCDVIHRYFLTGGIDYLLDERSDTRVFHAVVSR
jgi:hypothetical protein